MSISFEKKMAPLEAQCCFAPFSSNPELIIPTSPRVFKSTHIQYKKIVNESDSQMKERKEGIQAMKKSISSINLKRKYSDGFPTNRISINNSQFLPKYEKRFITHSMDTEILKEYLPNYQSTDSLNSGRMMDLRNEQKTQEYFGNSNQTLDSLAEKFKKSRDIKIQNHVEQTKKHIQEHFPFQTLAQTQNPQKTFGKQIYKIGSLAQNDFKTQQKGIGSNRLELRKPLKQAFISKTLQQKATKKPVKQNQYTGIQSRQYPLNIEMNQVDSMIIEISTPKNSSFIDHKAFFKKDKQHLGANTEITESRHFSGSQITKTKKRSITAERQLANYDTMTVNSDYQDDEHKKVEKIEESAIMINFFNPPSFIKEKLALSGTKHA